MQCDVFLDVDCPSGSDKILKNPANSDLSIKDHLKPKLLTEVPRHLNYVWCHNYAHPLQPYFLPLTLCCELPKITPHIFVL